jgi:acetolactate synthase-1/2/3 large subunit
MSLLDDIYLTPGLKYISARHEQAAVFMADGYSRISGKPSVCLVHVGPGVTNTVTAVANAYKDCSPVILISGDKQAKHLERDTYHEVDVTAMLKPVTKWSYRIKDAAEIPRVMRSALVRAAAGRPGPVHVALPEDIARTPWKLPDDPPRKEDDSGFLSQWAPEVPLIRTAPDPALVVRAAELINSHERVLLLVGGGVIWSGAWGEVNTIVDNYHIPAVTSDSGRGAVREDHPYYMGICGSFRDAAANEALKSCEVLLALGCPFSDVTTDSWSLISPRTKLIQVDIDPDRVSYQYGADIGIVSDIQLFLQALLPLLKNRSKQTFRAGSSDGATARNTILSPASSGKVRPQALVEAIKGLMPESTIIAVDTGMHYHFARQAPVYGPRQFLRSSGFGAMGFAFPAAMGAKLVKPDAHVIAIVGDGGFAMVSQELETAVRCRIPVLVIVFNNYGFGSQRLQQMRGYNSRFIGVDHNNPDFAGLARLYGALGIKITDEESLRPALEELLFSGKPAVAEILVDPKVVPERWRQG